MSNGTILQHVPQLSELARAPVRAYFVGPHAAGKTSIARWAAKNFRLPLVSEVARSVLAEMEIPLDVLRVDLERTRQFQMEVFKRQAAAEDKAGPAFVADRSGVDNLAYAASHTLALSEIAPDARLREYAGRLKGRDAVVFYVRPHPSISGDDGVRERMDWDEIQRIDGMVRFMLEFFDVDYIALSSPSMVDRARSIRAVFKAMGILPVGVEAS